MKREKFLWPLTQSHHRALMAAKRVRESLSGPANPKTGGLEKALSNELKALYDGELQKHFWDEEKILTLYDGHMGKEEPEPARIRKEHRLLESLLGKEDRESLLHFAETLTAHVRFEEDVLFGRIESILNESEKEAVLKLISFAGQPLPPA